MKLLLAILLFSSTAFANANIFPASFECSSLDFVSLKLLDYETKSKCTNEENCYIEVKVNGDVILEQAYSERVKTSKNTLQFITLGEAPSDADETFLTILFQPNKLVTQVTIISTTGGVQKTVLSCLRKRL